MKRLEKRDFNLHPTPLYPGFTVPTGFPSDAQWPGAQHQALRAALPFVLELVYLCEVE